MAGEEQKKEQNLTFNQAVAQMEEAIPFFGPYMTDLDVVFCDLQDQLWGAPQACEYKRQVQSNRAK